MWGVSIHKDRKKKKKACDKETMEIQSKPWMVVLSKITASGRFLCNWTISDFSIVSYVSNSKIQHIIDANWIFASLWNHDVATSQRWWKTKETSKPALCKSLTASLHSNNRSSVKAFTWVSCISISTATKILNKGFPTAESTVNYPMKSLCLVRRCSNNGTLFEGTKNLWIHVLRPTKL